MATLWLNILPMKHFFVAAAALILFLFTSCTEKTTFNEAGGNLPSNYIIVQRDGTFGPAMLTVASGSTITFVNNDLNAHQFMSNDTLSINTPRIEPGASYVFQNDTIYGAFPYKCILDTALRGTIIITP